MAHRHTLLPHSSRGISMKRNSRLPVRGATAAVGVGVLLAGLPTAGRSAEPAASGSIAPDGSTGQKQAPAQGPSRSPSVHPRGVTGPGAPQGQIQGARPGALTPDRTTLNPGQAQIPAQKQFLQTQAPGQMQTPRQMQTPGQMQAPGQVQAPGQMQAPQIQAPGQKQQ